MPMDAVVLTNGLNAFKSVSSKEKMDELIASGWSIVKQHPPSAPLTDDAVTVVRCVDSLPNDGKGGTLYVAPGGKASRKKNGTMKPV